MMNHQGITNGRRYEIAPLACLLACVLLLESTGWTAQLAGTNDPRVNFNRDIRPILSDNCFACHGPDEKSRQADLRLDQKSVAFSAPNGFPIIVPGNPENSEIIFRVTHEDESERMPPNKTGKRLDGSQIELLTRWIQQGAPWDEHWAFVKPSRPSVPETTNHEWGRNPIDGFVLARLESEGLEPSTDASKRSLIRRATLDLTGLPPTRTEVRAFVADDRPAAYEMLIDGLLERPQYGEHLAHFWLDAARYGDTHGLHLDNYREMWPYRDWVVNAFNRNMRFDQFTVEQLAGDLLANPSTQQQTATGFNRCNVTTSEGGSIRDEVYVRYAGDRVNTTSTVWMGLTAGCASCHDHKFDPITQKEYYKLSAFFNNVSEDAMDRNRKDPAPVIKLPTSEESERMASYDRRIKSLEDLIKAPMTGVDVAQSRWEAELTEWRPVQAEDLVSLVSLAGATMSLLADGSIQASGKNPDTDTYEIVARVPAGKHMAVRLEGLRSEDSPDARSASATTDAPPALDTADAPSASDTNGEAQAKTKGVTKKLIGRSKSGNVILTEFELEFAAVKEPGEWTPVRFVHAWADYEQPGDFGILNTIDGCRESGWGIGGSQARGARQAVFLAELPFGESDDYWIRARLKHESQYKRHQFNRFRLSVATEPPRSPGSSIKLGDWYELGPFEAREGNVAFHQRYEPEGNPVNKGFQFKHHDRVLKWVKRTAWPDRDATVELTGEKCASYIYRNVVSETKQRAVLTVRANGGLKLWVNGYELFAGRFRSETEAKRIQVPLNAGGNEVLLKVVDFSGEYGFFFGLESGPVMVPSEVFDWTRLSPNERSPEQRTGIRNFYRAMVSSDPELRGLRNELSNLRKKRTALDESIVTSMVMKERKEARKTYVLRRGQYDQRLEQVSPGTPAMLPSMPDDAPATRLGFARWLVDPSHPLTPRVAVNRLWQNIFGAGLVRTSEDFGSRGEPPSHPALLDWLAVEFVESGWDVKHVLGLMLTSSTYRQLSKVRPELLARDPDNRLLGRGPRFRLDAEMLRDQALAISGLLRPTMGGPSVKPPQPDGLWKVVGYVGSNTMWFEQDHGPDRVYRRSLYTFWKRTAPPPQMSVFDAPSREVCVVRRERTNTPLQALVLLNEPQYFEAARAFAERTLLEGGRSDEDRMAFAFETATARLPDSEELSILLGVLDQHQEEFSRDPKRAAVLASAHSPSDSGLGLAELAAWIMVTNLILNLDEVVSKG